MFHQRVMVALRLKSPSCKPLFVVSRLMVLYMMVSPGRAEPFGMDRLNVVDFPAEMQTSHGKCRYVFRPLCRMMLSGAIERICRPAVNSRMPVRLLLLRVISNCVGEIYLAVILMMSRGVVSMYL